MCVWYKSWISVPRDSNLQRNTKNCNVREARKTEEYNSNDDRRTHYSNTQTNTVRWPNRQVVKGWGEVRIDFRIIAFMYCKSVHNHKIHRTTQSIIREKPRRAPIGWYQFWAVTSSKTIRADLSLHYTYISFVSALVYIFSFRVYVA